MIGTTAAILGGAALSGGGSLLGGILGRGRAKQIGTIEQQAAEDEQRRIYERLAEQNPRIAEEYLKAQQGLESTAYPQADLVQQRGEQAGSDVMAATREGVGYLDPYAQAGQRAVTSLEQLAALKAPTAADLEFDPGYQFRLSEGQKALERSAAARGTLQGGGTLKALTRYAQGAASQEYANAFDRFMKQQEGRRATLSDLAGRGLSASGSAASLLQGGSEYAGNIGMRGSEFGANMRVGAARDIGRLGVESRMTQENMTTAAEAAAREQRARATAARTGSQVAASNAFNQGLGGAFNAAGQGLTLYGLSQGGNATSGAKVPSWVYTGQIPGRRGVGRLDYGMDPQYYARMLGNTWGMG